MTRTLESLREINLDWLNQTLSLTEDFKEKTVVELDVKRIGEGIGQLGEFALLDTTLDCGKKLNIFAKIQTETEDMDNIARDYQFYVREVKFYQNLSSKLMAIVASGKRTKIYLDPSNEHENIAKQYFSKFGTLALLPLNQNLQHYSIILCTNSTSDATAQLENLNQEFNLSLDILVTFCKPPL